VTEWTDYDEEMQRLGQEIAKSKSEERTPATPSARDKPESSLNKDEL
jgi:hypothetical protein